MRRDVCYYFPVGVEQLYNAYLTAATNPRFRRDCNQEPYHTLSFGLNFSMKYNFNGGSCTVRFISWQNGSAVNLRFSIAQLAGARYEKYAQDLTDDAIKVLGISGQKADIDVELFVSSENKIIDTPKPADTSPSIQSAIAKVCPNCSKEVKETDKFCSSCGTPLSVQKRFCSNCGKEVLKEAAFCSNCGNKL